MANSQTFVDHVLDLVSLLGQPVQARRMFGGHGLYARGAMFGLLDDDELFLKTDAETRPRFVEAGCRRWVYGEMRETSYFRPPDEAHEDATAMLPWARLALEAALRGKAAAAARAAARARKRASGGREPRAGEDSPRGRREGTGRPAPALAKAGGERTGPAPRARPAAGRKTATVSVRGAGKATAAQRRRPRRPR